ncbi:MAG TPA: amidohydrolase family protein [Phycisphaerae bacterium]|nr:amidohydrolase family protein [Phycisphaerae bacterium]
MRIVDCHVHQHAPAEADGVLRDMDANGVERILVCSPQERVSLPKTRENLLLTRKLFEAAPDRIGGLAWIEPTLPGARGLAREALAEMGFVGIKIIPDHWYAYEPRLEPFWETMHELRASILFHTGILYGNDDGSRFCRPLWLEKLLHYPNIRFAMAHISWPWCEECLAVMGRMRAAAGYGKARWQSYVDITRGTPAHIREQALANAVSFCGPERIMFGTDSRVPDGLAKQAEHIEIDLGIFRKLGLDEAQIERIMSGTADEVFPAR